MTNFNGLDVEMQEKHWQIWIDTGGTFTDCVAISPEGRQCRAKVLSSSSLRGRIQSHTADGGLQVLAPWLNKDSLFRSYQFRLLDTSHRKVSVSKAIAKEAILYLDDPDFAKSIATGAEFEITAGEEAPVLAARLVTNTPLDESLPLIRMRLGTTRGTNALLQADTAPVALITNAGLEDMLSIGTQARPDLFALNIRKKKHLYKEVFGIKGRLSSRGEEIEAIDDSQIRELAKELKNAGYSCVAIALLHSYLNPSHEKRVQQALETEGIPWVSASSGLSSEIKILPRAETAVIDAALSPVINDYLRSVRESLPNNRLKVMTSAGGLTAAHLYHPKDSLLSGPAGGVIGVAAIARQLGLDAVLSFDMGGTSTDVARVEEGMPDYRYEQQIGDAYLQSPTIAIDTVAAGGGSVCHFDGYKYTVGPESAGAYPGPAAYGAGGPLTITDVNLLLGRLSNQGMSIPVLASKAREALDALLGEDAKADEVVNKALISFLQIANEKMAETIRQIAVRKGYEPSEHALVAFGGAGGQHACAIAELLNIETVVIPADSGLLSACGLGIAPVQRFATLQVNRPWQECIDILEEMIADLEKKAIEAISQENIPVDDVQITLRKLNLRMQGQDSSIEIDYRKGEDIKSKFQDRYTQVYGHWVGWQALELESIRVQSSYLNDSGITSVTAEPPHTLMPIEHQQAWVRGQWQEIPVYASDILPAETRVEGPAILLNTNYTLYIDKGWKIDIHDSGHGIMTPMAVDKDRKEHIIDFTEAGKLELFTNRFSSIAEEMGALLQRTAFSVNVKERLDFSCAIMDQEGDLIINAPHIPVHLGSLGLCTRLVHAKLSLQKGDVAITNHPAFGGSHLPDITLIAPVHDDSGKLIAWVGNRAHHAELGSKRPGSMPPDAAHLSEEGVVIAPEFLVKDGQVRWDAIESLLKQGSYPSRAPQENIADLRAALAAIEQGKEKLKALCRKFGTDEVLTYLHKIKEYAAYHMAEVIQDMDDHYEACEYLDDGTPLRVTIKKKNTQLHVSFEGTGLQHPGNLNANEAITRSVVLYTLRLLLSKKAPLNEGLLQKVKLSIPQGSILSPVFSDTPEECPAVVGGNTETSQRLVDTMLRALGLAACSQGTMNNVIFGNDEFSYYETIGGGTGAGPGFDGCDAVHQHMTNTRMTDPEIFELRFPVRLQTFAIRLDSGGKGQFTGGNGIIREIEFLEPVHLTLLSQHRIEEPYGLSGGDPGSYGEQWVVTKGGHKLPLIGITEAYLLTGERFIIHTPGGGGYGKA